MALASGADVKVGAFEFQIDRSVDSCYVHRIYDLQAASTDIPGMPNKKTLDDDRLLWVADDWAGGDGNRIFYQDDWDKYAFSGGLNPRIRGELTARPVRTVTQSGTGATDISSRMFTGGGNIYENVGGGTNKLSTANYNWSAAFGAYGSGTAACGDFNNVYVLDASTVSVCPVHVGSPTPGATTTAPSPANDPIGAGLIDGTLYGWTGAELWSYDVADIANWASDHYTKVHDPGGLPNAGDWGSDWYGDLVQADTSLVYWRSAYGRSEVFQYKDWGSTGWAGVPLWTAPIGFTIRSSCYQNGTVFFGGHWGAAGEGWGALYGINLNSYQPTHLKWIGKLEGLHYPVTSIAPSYGNQIIISSGGEHAYIYDAEYDALSVLDFKNGSTFSACITMGDKRYVGDNATMNAYDDDEPEERALGFNLTDISTADATLTSSKWDWDYPMESKTLSGFHVTFSPLISGQYIDIEYQLDDGSWVAITQITASTSGADKGRVFVSVAASNLQFFQMRYRVKLTSSTGVLAPILYAITVEASASLSTNKREEWEIIVRLKDESSRTRPINRELEGPTIRDWLLSVVEGGGNVTFLDGFRYHNLGEYSTETVIIQEMTDVIAEPGEGACRLVLKSVTKET